jgi:hypothetical protein
MAGPQILRLGLIALGGALHLPAQTPPDPAGLVLGTVVMPDNSPVARASVMVQSQQDSGGAPFRASVFTQPDGSFVVPGVPPGRHRVCVQAPGTALLNPCTWSAAPPAITVSARQAASVGTIRLETGHLVKVRLLDAGRLLEAAEGVPGVQVQIGVWTSNGLFIPMRIRTRDATSRDLELPVPFGAPFELSVQSSFFDLADENNARVDPVRGARLPLQVAAGTPSTVRAFTVTGRRAETGRP